MDNDPTLTALGLTPGQGEVIRRFALRTFVALIGLNALVAIGAIVGVGDGGGDDERWQVLGTSSIITLASLIVAANAGAIQRGRLGPAPLISTAAAVVGCAGTIWGIWDHDVSDTAWRTIGVFSTVGVAGTYMSLVSLPRLRQPWVVAQIVGGASAGLMGLLVVIAIVGDNGGSIEPYAVLSVILAAATLLVTVGARVAPAEPSNATPGNVTGQPTSRLADSASSMVTHCPLCGVHVPPHAAGEEHTCRNCMAQFRVTVGPNRSINLPGHDEPTSSRLNQD